MNEAQYPKIHYDSKGSTLYLNFGEYGQQIELACFSGDGTKLLTVKEVGVASVWDVASGTLLQEIYPTSPLIGKAGISPIGSEFAIFIESVALNGNGSLALLGLNDGTAGIFSTQDGAHLSTFCPPDTKPSAQWNVIRAVNFSPDDTLALVGFPHRAIGIWRVADNTLVQFLRSLHSERIFNKPFVRDTLVSTVAASQDNQYIFAGFADMTATIWKLENKEVIFDAFQHVEHIVGLWVHNEQVRWATTGGNVWKGDDNQGIVQQLITGESWIEAQFSASGQEILVRTIDGFINHWSLDGKSEGYGQASPDLSDKVKTIAFGQEKELTLYVEGETQVNIIAPENSSKVEHDRRIGGFTLSPQEDLLATYGWSGSVEIWQLPKGKQLHALSHNETVSTVAFSRDGTFLAVGVLGQGGSGAIRPIYLWNLRTGNLWCKLEGHIHQVHALAFGPNDKWVVSTSLDRTVRLWQLDSNKPSNSFEISQLKYDDLEFHHITVLSDGRIIVFRRNKLEVWQDQQKLEIPVPYYFDNQWYITEDESFILGSFGQQVIRKWSFHNRTLLI